MVEKDGTTKTWSVLRYRNGKTWTERETKRKKDIDTERPTQTETRRVTKKTRERRGKNGVV